MNIPTGVEVRSTPGLLEPGAKVVALSGHKYYAATPLGGPDADAIMYYQGDPKGRYIPVAVPGHVPPAGLLTDARHERDDLLVALDVAREQERVAHLRRQLADIFR